MQGNRRTFLTASGQLLGAGWIALHWPTISAAAADAQAATESGAPPRFAHLTSAQALDLDAIASQIVPSDETPGAHEAGAINFMDAALGSFFAVHREEFLSQHMSFAADFAGRHGGASFARSEGERQIDYLQSIAPTPFFQSVRFLTVLGLLAHPKYGGNRDGVGWKLVGFEDQHVFSPPFGYYDRDYPGFVPYAKKGTT
jgi:gluconate 2-dehydrogenase gamma chain